MTDTTHLPAFPDVVAHEELKVNEEVPFRSSRRTRRVVAAASLGTAFEYYDMHIYGLAASLVFAAAYFPGGEPSSAALAAFATFAVAYFARPLGAVVFGHLGDRIGRKQTLQLTFLVMGIATVLIGFLPTYAAVGVAAPVLLVLLRLLQGFAVGGETGGAWVTLVEYAPANRRGFYGAFVMAASGLGAIIGSVVFVFLGAALSEEAFGSWGWRLPFLVTVLLIPLGLYLRHRVEETPEFRSLLAAGREVRVPIVTVLREHWQVVLLAAGISTPFLAATYVTTFYGTSFLHTVQGASTTFALALPLVFLTTQMVLSPVFGHLSDLWERRRVFRAALAGLLVYAIPFFLLLSSKNVALILLAVFLMGIVAAAIGGTLGTFLSEQFAGNVRYTGLSVGYQLGSILGGGLSPLIATAILTWSGDSWTVGLYLAAVSIVALLCMTRLHGASLGSATSDDDPDERPADAAVVESTPPTRA
ncbi:MFS transporter [Pseudonocardia sp.]|uniref:MFS transporter n=1 Tax=Pseudonocardia sp. TaxID=60912 RepID=UPI0031FC1CDB